MADPKESTSIWTCPKCQAANDPEFVRCRLCGEPKPGHEHAAMTCKLCGHSVFAKDSCCPACGSKEFLQL